MVLKVLRVLNCLCLLGALGWGPWRASLGLGLPFLLGSRYRPPFGALPWLLQEDCGC